MFRLITKLEIQKELKLLIFQSLFSALFILNKIIDIKNNIKPAIKDPNATSVDGIEKYLVSLKITATTTE